MLYFFPFSIQMPAATDRTAEAWVRGDTPRSRLGVTAKSCYSMSEVRGSRQEEQLHVQGVVAAWVQEG